MQARKEWFYEYRELFSLCDERKVESVANGISKQYSVITKNWNETINSEWCCRIYLATKMILNATVLLNSLNFSKQVGMRITDSYLAYYATLSLLRAVVFTLPSESWNDGKLIEISHQKAINLAFDWLSKFNQEKSKELKIFTLQLKAQREVISYKIPASGDSVLDLRDEYYLNELLTVLAEMAQFNSELLEASVTRNASEKHFLLLNEQAEKVAFLEVDGCKVADDEDCYRLDYIRRKIRRPYNIKLFMTEGQTEDFMAAWDSDADDEGLFNNGSPADWQSIFDIP